MVYKFFDKKSASFDKSKRSGIINEPNYQLANELIIIINQLLENLKKEKFIHHLEIIFGVLI